MEALNALAEKLVRYPELQWVRDENSIRIEAPRPDGFAIELHYSGNEWTVYLGSGGWHQHFDDGADALNFIAWCYSGDARVREIRCGHIIRKSVLEACVGDSWERVAVVGYFPAAFWRKKSETVLQNPNLLLARPQNGNL